MGKHLIFCLYFHFLCRCRNKQFDVHFRRIRLVLLLSKDREDAAYEGRDGWKSV